MKSKAMQQPGQPAAGNTRLKRSLGLGVLTLYGVGIIIGAGIYVLTGQVASAAGMGTPLSFLLAGLLAAPTGLSFAELSARHPEASGQAAYAYSAFRNGFLSRVIGFAVVAVGILAAASIARGCAGYLAGLAPVISIPVGSALIVMLFTAVACLAVANSVAAAAVMTVIEIGGLIYVVSSGLYQTLDYIPPAFSFEPTAIASGAFIAMFAFLGFETLANMAEETIDPGKTLPRAILLALAIATSLYVIVAYVAVKVVPIEVLSSSATPLLDVVIQSPIGNAVIFGLVALIATANGVLIEIMMASRMLYGMADRGWLPRRLAHVWPRTQAPVRTTLITGIILLALVVPYDVGELAAAASNVLLSVFIVTNLALMRLHRREPRPDLVIIRAPRWIPPLGAIGAAGLLAAQLF
ncbi:MAG: APC family permease [Alphaproteobacteria bacterium]